MSSPNEPEYPGSRDGSAAGNALDRNSGDVPPWQRGPAARSHQAPARPQHESQTRQDSVPSNSPGGHSPGVDDRLNRFIAGAPPPARPPGPPQSADVETAQGRNETIRASPGELAYASELPDLSGPKPRPQQRKPPAERAATDDPAPAAAASSTRPKTSAGRVQVGTRHKGPVRASMQIRRVDPWSALKVSLVLSVALFFIWMIAVAFLYLVLGGMGVWSKLNSNVGDLLTNTSSGELVSSSTIFGGAALIGLVNIVLLSAAATIGAFIYNLTTDIVGGVEVTLADRD